MGMLCGLDLIGLTPASLSQETRVMPRLSVVATILCVVIVTMAVAGGAARGQLADAPQVVDQITFVSSRAASVLLVTGNRLRCDLVSMTAEMVVVQNNQRRNEIEMSKIRSIRSTDGKFDYTPADESFESLLRRCRRIPGVSVGKLEVFDTIEAEGTAPANGSDDPSKRGPPHAGGPPTLTAGPTGTASNGAPTGSAQGEANPPESSNPANQGASPSTTQTARSNTFCANCMKEIPPTLNNGDRCPHCGVIFWDVNRTLPSKSTAGAANPSGDSEGTNSLLTPGPKNGQNPSILETGSTNATPAPVSATPTTITTGGGTLDNMPMWMKVGLFAGMLAIAWLLLQRR
jgi:hypothetical protein